MSRSERWNTKNEIKRRFHDTTDPVQGAGPIIYFENGRKYSDDSESHIAVIGRTGKGKSQCCSLPFERECLLKGESLIVLDPKGEGYRKNSCYIPEDYQNFCVDLRNPRQSPTKWNPLSMPYRLFKSSDPDDHDVASSIISELWSGVYPYDAHSDRFWPESAANYAKGLTYALLETQPEEYVNLDSVAVMMEQSEIRFGGNNVLKTYYEMLPIDSLARRNLAAYATGPNDTRASIHSVAASGLEVFSRSKGLMEMLSEDTLRIMDIDVTRPFILTIITPDETDVYDTLSGLLISQFTQHLIRVAQDMGGRLPIRVNVILEELGSVGRAISQLPNMMVASRSRNIRLMLVLQSGSAQLIDVYGKSKAEVINSCIGITIGFSTNSWETLNEWVQRCGEKQVDSGSHVIKEQLITATQLAAMPTGTALVMVDNQYKFIAHFPFYDEMYDNSGWKAPETRPVRRRKELKSFNFEEHVKELKRKMVSERMGGEKDDSLSPFYRPFDSDPFGVSGSGPFGSSGSGPFGSSGSSGSSGSGSSGSSGSGPFGSSDTGSSGSSGSSDSGPFGSSGSETSGSSGGSGEEHSAEISEIPEISDELANGIEILIREDEEEKEEDKKRPRNKRKTVKVRVYSSPKNRVSIARAYAAINGVAFSTAMRILSASPCLIDIKFDKCDTFIRFVRNRDGIAEVVN